MGKKMVAFFCPTIFLPITLTYDDELGKEAEPLSHSHEFQSVLRNTRCCSAIDSRQLRIRPATGPLRTLLYSDKPMELVTTEIVFVLRRQSIG